MSQALITPVPDCCVSCPDEGSGTEIPGPQGPAGPAGADGTDGINAFTLLTAGFVMPAVSGPVTVNVADNSWCAVLQPLFVTGAGFMQVSAKIGTTQITLLNMGYTGNAAPASIIATSGRVVPGGMQGIAGVLSGPAGGDLGGNYPNPTISVLTTKGDLMGNIGANNARLAVGADGTTLHADSTQALGIAWGKTNLASPTQVTGVLPIANGGTAGATVAAARAALSAAALGANSDITSMTGLTTPLALAYGGVGAATAVGGRSTLGLAQVPRLPGYAMHSEVLGVDGGNFVTGAWRTVALNSVVGSMFSLAATQLTALLTGHLWLEAQVAAYEVNSFKLRFFDVTAGSICGQESISFRAAAAVDSVELGFLNLYYQTITAGHVYELQATCETTKNTTGFGKASNLGTAELYAYANFWFTD